MRQLIKQTKLEIELYNPHKYATAVLIFKDMLFYLQIWRQIKGYSKNNQRTHSNNKTNKKRKLINTFRLQQFYRLFGRKKRDIFPTLIVAEYTNRLWYLVWYEQWVSAWVFICNLALKNKIFSDWESEISWGRQLWNSESAYSPGLIDQARKQDTELIKFALIFPFKKYQTLRLELRSLKNQENISILEYKNKSILLNWTWQK